MSQALSKNYTKSKQEHPLFQTWRWMIRMSVKSSVCEDWQNSLENFHKDMGDRPSKDHLLDRVDKNLGYSKSNCVWKKQIKRFGEERMEYLRKTQKEWRFQNPDKVKNIDLKKHHGISLREYEAMLEKQNGVCAICGKPEMTEIRGKVINLAVDHCHKDKNIRGLLCISCNRGLGLFKDSIETLELAIKYLVNGRG